jgi:hypothetical protein
LRAWPESLLVRTWQNGQGFQLTLDRGGQKVIRPIGDQLKPELIGKHGTIVTVLGKNPDDRTAAVPADVLGGAGWVLKYLNTKFFELPNGVTIRARGGKGLERAHGLAHYLFKFAADSGKVTLRESGFRANWFVLPKGRDDDKGTPYAQLRNYTTLTGSISILFENELYNSQSVREAEGNPLRPFGIYTGGNRIAIMLCPLDPSEYEPTLQRSMLEKRVAGGVEPIPICSIAAEFASQIPQKLKVFMADRDAKSQIKKDDYLDKKLHDVHGFDLVEWQKGKVRRPANGGRRVPFTPRPEPGNSANVAPSPAEEEPSDRSRPSLPPPELEDGRVTASVGANKNFHRRRDLPAISVHSADDLPADTWAEYMDGDVRRLSINRSWAGLGGHFAAVARRQGFPATDVQKDQIITRLIHNSKDGVLTAYEHLAAKVITQEKFTELTGPLGLTAAACPRTSLVNHIHAGKAPENAR